MNNEWIGYAIGLCGFAFGAFGWLLRHSGRLTRAETWIDSLRERAQNFEVQIVDTLKRIESKLDTKQDKPK